MAMFLFDQIFDAAIKTSWTGMKNYGRGIRGTHTKMDEAGDVYSVSPLRDSLVGDIKRHGKQAFTGYKYNKKGEIVDKDIGAWQKTKNRLSGSLGAVADITVGSSAQAMGWATRAAGVAAWGTAKWAGPQLAKQAGYTTKEAFDLIGDTALDAGDAVRHMSRSGVGQVALFGGALGVAGAAPFAKDIMTDSSPVGKGMQAYVGSNLETVAGTSQSNRYVDDLGADGDLVFAMHNLR